MDRFGDLEIEAVRDGDLFVITLIGELDVGGVERVTQALLEAQTSDATQILVDLGALTFISSSGVRLLLEADGRLRADGRTLRMTRGPADVQRVFELSGLEDRMPWSDRTD